MIRIERTPLADQASDILMTRIHSGEWQLGQKLPGETTLAAQLGVGRSTIREAIRQLAGRGMLSTRQGSGVFVTALEVPEDWDAVLRRADIVAVIEARTAIEAEAAALAASRRTASDLRLIRRALVGRRAHPAGVEAHVDADTAFHRSIVAAAHNPILLELFDGFTPRMRQAMIEMLRLRADDGGRADDDRHTLLADAVAARDSARAAAESRTHLADLAKTLG
ncbi:FadR family transcriptional regulator [Microbacterium foliorum]|uniref:HTH-type transcriptional regulator LutR n=1 Tax=Microbacterium foliorum TaxID=104336 RepID=A0A0F0L5U3_9MICO|nr:FCD domain-containing protein [Microbacterium foliorum]AXL12821.1 FadR family transcriptional regulator [Microbacterium foliorum]KJL26901.1 HTH-type transcriptional regulator LutR [Microbacterium foliorum]